MHFCRTLIAGICIAWMIAGCGGGDDAQPVNSTPGTLVSAESMGTYQSFILRQLLALYDAPVALEPRYNVQAYRVVYITRNAQGLPVKASGAIFLPTGANNLPLISLQHFTQTDCSAVASVVPLTSSPDAILTASVGYASCAPDYIGLGSSEGVHPYLHAKASANAVMDMIRACRSFCASEGIKLNGQLFLAGYSEGAYATMAAQRAMEADSPAEFTITAAACLSGPYDLETTAAAIFADPYHKNMAFTTYMLVAYDDIYGWNQLDEMFLDPYSGRVGALFDGSHSLEEVQTALSGTVADLLSPEFRTSYINGTATNVLAAVRENTLLGWRPIAPIHIYHGTADNLAPFENATAAASSLGSQPGTSVTLYPVQGAGHEDAIISSLNATFQWFESMRR
ncbi:MAG: lipase family protein [bacterium]